MPISYFNIGFYPCLGIMELVKEKKHLFKTGVFDFNDQTVFFHYEIAQVHDVITYRHVSLAIYQ